MEKNWSKWGIGFLVVILMMSIPYFAWKISDKQVLHVAILDKTVPTDDYREHNGLVWILNHLKYTKEDGGSYSVEEDYFGFFPKSNQTYEIKDLKLTGQEDLLYITDTYGVFEEDYGHSLGDRSSLIYGGLQMEDVEEIQRAIFQGMPLIAEFNSFASPTDADVKQSMYKILGLNWSGWIGRSFADLTEGKEVPNWAVSNFESQYQTEWTFKGNGFLFVNELDEIIVLEGGIDTGSKGTTFSLTSKGRQFFGDDINTRYNYWFDITEADHEDSILANYQLDLTKEGKKKLADVGISTTFPALIRNDTGVYTSYYFAGDYADSNEIPAFFQFAWLAKVAAWFSWESKESLQPFFWKAYLPMMKTILADIAAKKAEEVTITEPEVEIEDGTFLNARTNEMNLQVYQNGDWEDFFVKGVNMGFALPGKWFTNFPRDEADYLRWFKMIGEMNSNTIRVYTLMDPAFYRALLAYNQKADSPLWLMQEIWPEEHPKNEDFLDKEYNDAFHKEIEYVIDAIHGNANIPERQGRAYGQYTANVASYVLGYLVGRELEPEEVLATDERNEGFTFEGDYLAVKNGSPTESWLAWSSDYVLAYEEENYSWQHPVAIVSWPTLDALTHDSEFNPDGQPAYNDKATVDIRNLSLGTSMKAGLFGAYHIYPNYPDFMNNEEAYNRYHDEEGRLRYGAYLQAFMNIHQGYPAVVAEFGLATGMGNAHVSPDGYHHGGMTEEEQGEGIVRMMKAIEREGYAGGIIFEWMDEWAKKTWTTEPFMIPYERHVFWHNAIDPEQNYGILAIEPKPFKEPDFVLEGDKNIKKVAMHADEAFLHLFIETDKKIDWETEELLIGLDTYDPLKGEMLFRPELPVQSPTGLEFLVEIKDEQEAKLLAASSYNIGTFSYSSKRSESGEFVEMYRLINKAGVRKDGTTYEEHEENGSLLKHGRFEGTNHHYFIEGNSLHIRLPWGRLNVTDPSSHQVLHDSGNNSSPERDELQTTTTDGIRLSMVWLNHENEVLEVFPGGNTFSKPEPHLWNKWETPSYQERLKMSYSIIQQSFGSMK